MINEAITNIVNKALARGTILTFLFYLGFSVSVDNPQLQEIWVGIASYGAYAGILAGLFVPYAVIHFVITPYRDIKKSVTNAGIASVVMTLFFLLGVDFGYENITYWTETNSQTIYILGRFAGTIICISLILGTGNFVEWLWTTPTDKEKKTPEIDVEWQFEQQ